jgi:phosphoribosylformylglycinamidine synthase
MNPYFGDLDPYHMAASNIDEAIRNCVAVGADPNRIAILDNFCWGYTDRPETLGSLVRAAIACHDVATVFRTPFISGKDSLHNEFSFTNTAGDRQTISIPSTLLISAIGQVDDVCHCVTMDMKQTGNLIYLIGQTRDEMGGSHWCLVNAQTGGNVPTVDAAGNRVNYLNLHAAIRSGLVRSCHDLSEGGLAVAAAEMAFAGGLGIELELGTVCENENLMPCVALFSESNGRFLCEVEPVNIEAFESILGQAGQLVGWVSNSGRFQIKSDKNMLIESDLNTLKSAWIQPLDWS